MDADGGVSLDDIALASRDCLAALDDSAVMGEQPYTLEVSSPGVDRPLTERRHWRRAIGRLVSAPLVSGGPDLASARGPRTRGPAMVEGRVTGGQRRRRSRWKSTARAGSLATVTSARAR